LAGLGDWPQVQPKRAGTGKRLLYQVVAALALFLVVLGLKESGGPVGKKVEVGLRKVLTTEWNYQPVVERIVRHGLLAVGTDLPFWGEPAKPAGAPAAPKLLVPVSGRVSRGYGWNKNSATGLEEFHPGIDIEASPGTPVRAVADGKVAKIGTDPALGNYLLLDHGKNEATLYAHLGSVEVTLGQRVAAGEVIGTTGDNGDIAGGGLHFEYRENGRPVDPLARIAVTGKGQKE